MKLLSFLQEHTDSGMTLPALVDTFEEMCRIPLEEERLLFETGTFDFYGDRRFCFSLVRQFPLGGSDEYCQIHMDLLFPATEQNRVFHSNIWNDEVEGDFFRCVRNSRAYLAMQDIPLAKVEIYQDET